MSFGQSPLWSFGEKDFQTNTPWASCTPSTNDSCTSFSPTSISPALRTQELFSPSPSTSLSQSSGSSQSKVEWSPSHFGFWFFHSTAAMRQKGTQTYRLNRHDLATSLYKHKGTQTDKPLQGHGRGHSLETSHTHCTLAACMGYGPHPPYTCFYYVKCALYCT